MMGPLDQFGSSPLDAPQSPLTDSTVSSQESPIADLIERDARRQLALGLYQDALQPQPFASLGSMLRGWDFKTP